MKPMSRHVGSLLRDAMKRRVCTASLADARMSGTLSVRERLRRERLDPDVLELISDLGLGRQKRGGRPSGAASASASTNVLARMGFRQAANSAHNLPKPPLAEIAFAGRSNVGKSSLLNALAGKSCGTRGTVGVAAVANRPGVTRSINFYANAHGAQLVDLPGCTLEPAESWQGRHRSLLLGLAQVRVLRAQMASRSRARTRSLAGRGRCVLISLRAVSRCACFSFSTRARVSSSRIASFCSGWTERHECRCMW